MTGDTTKQRAPAIWAVMVGYNNFEDSVEALQSVMQSGTPGLRVVFVDNHSHDHSADIVRIRFPDVDVIRMKENVGFARGYNAGIAHALDRGAEYVFMLNNDTTINRETIPHLIRDAQAHPEAGIFAPKIYYYAFPDTIWSAGSRYRRFPPVVVLRKTGGPDDGRYDTTLDLEFVTTCALLFPRRFLDLVGLLDPNYFILCDDYDLCLRARRAGFGIRLVPRAHLWHKVSKSTLVGARNPFFWRQYGRSEAIFCRRNPEFGGMTGFLHLSYLLLRLLAEGKYFGFAPFIRGLKEGWRAEFKPVPKWNDPAVERGELLEAKAAEAPPPG